MLPILLLSLTLRSLAAPTTHVSIGEHDVVPTVTVDLGPVIGLQTSFANSTARVNKFLGIPFAASPTRFAPAETPMSWIEPFSAIENGPACIQQFNYPNRTRNLYESFYNDPPAPESEDCLSINVFAPSHTSGHDDLKPVMFWLYGGSFEFGWNGNPQYDGTNLAANQDVVVVVPNYRTNVFGFPLSPALPHEHQNLGYLDQHLALDWVQRNIASFGGDPNRVTIFGQSAGAESVDNLITAFSSRRHDEQLPFHAAIMQSGYTGLASLPYNEATWKVLIGSLNCTSSTSNSDEELLCARSVPAQTIISILEHHSLQFRPVLTGSAYTTGSKIERSAEIAPVPVLLGNTANDGSLFTLGQNDTQAFLHSRFPNITRAQVSSILKAYPLGTNIDEFPTQQAQVEAIETDYKLQCPIVRLANVSAAADMPTWRYIFNATFKITESRSLSELNLGAYHGSEIPLIFGTYMDASGLNATRSASESEEKRALSELMQGLWASFAKDPMRGPVSTKSSLAVRSSEFAWDEVTDGVVEVLGGPDGPVESGMQGQLSRQVNVWDVDGDRCDLWREILG